MSYNEAETRFFLIDEALRKKGYNSRQWLRLETQGTCPSKSEQQRITNRTKSALAEVEAMMQSCRDTLVDIKFLPQKILAHAFGDIQS